MDIDPIYRRSIADSPCLTRDEEHDLGVLAAAGDKKARETLILSLLPVAAIEAKEFRSRWLPLPDRIQIANVAVMEAVDGHDPSSGFLLATLAKKIIRLRIGREARRRGRLIRTPEHPKTRHGVETDADIESKVIAAMSCQTGAIEDDAIEPVFISREVDPQDAASSIEINIAVFALLDDLDGLSKKIVIASIGGASDGSISREVGLSRNRVSVWRRRAFMKLRCLAIKKGICVPGELSDESLELDENEEQLAIAEPVRRAGEMHRWTNDEDAAVLSLPVKQAAEKTGRTIVAVRLRKQRLSNRYGDKTKSRAA